MTISILDRILIIALGLVVVGAVGIVIYENAKMTQMQTQLSTSIVAMKELKDSIERSSSSYASKDDLNAFATAANVNLAAIKSDLAKLNASMDGVNQIIVASNGSHQTNVPSTNSTPDATQHPVPTVDCNGKQIPCPNADPNGYYSNTQTLALNEPFEKTSVPVGSVSFDASSKTPWSADVYPRKYNVINVMGTDQNGKHYVYNQFAVNVNGKDYKVAINNAQYKEIVPSPSFSFWNPRLFLSTGGSVNLIHLGGDVNLGATVGIMSFGSYRNNPDVSILQLGVGYQFIDKSPTLILNPVSINLGHIFSTGGLINNTYVGPSIQYDLHKNVFAGINFSLGL